MIDDFSQSGRSKIPKFHNKFRNTELESFRARGVSRGSQRIVCDSHFDDSLLTFKIYISVIHNFINAPFYGKLCKCSHT